MVPGSVIDAERGWSLEDKRVPKLELGNEGKDKCSVWTLGTREIASIYFPVDAG